MTLNSKREPCPKCGARRGFSVDEKGKGWCFACNASPDPVKDTEPDFMPTVDETFITDFTYQPLSVRGISEAACRRYKYGISKFKGKPCHVANWFDDTGKIIGQKYRTDGAEQKFSTVGKVEGLYGKTLMRGAGKRVYITEGELDCLAVSDALDNKWPVVSVPHGAGSAKKWIKKDLEWLESFEVVVLVFDSDEAGQKATSECRELFSPGKCHVAALVRKDPCEYLMANDRSSLVEALWGAKKWTPAGIIGGARLLELALDNTTARVECGWPWGPLNDACHGLRYRELVTIASGSGNGKSTFCREAAAHFLKHGEIVGYVALEESPRRTLLGLYGIQKNINLVTDFNPDTSVIREAHMAWGDRLYLFDHFGSTNTDELLSRIRYLVVGLGCKIIILDHLSIVVSGLEIDDERKAIDVIMTRLRTLVEETGCLLLVVSHLKRPPGKGHEEGEMVSLSHLRGSAAIAQLSDMVIGLERNQQDDDAEARQQVVVRVLKNRFSGRTGVAGVLSYDSDTGRLTHNVHKDF